MRGIFVAMVFWQFLPAPWASAQAQFSASGSFAVWSYRGGPSAEEMLQRCEGLREVLQKKWLGKTACEPWQPRCEIVLHSSRGSYLQAVGQGGTRTLGSSLIRNDAERVTHRRIDLLANSSGEFTAFSHELTHVVLAERFGGTPLPLWADEGIATVADTAAKKSLHQRDCLLALRNGTSLRIVDLLHLRQFSAPHQMPAFYGQSLSLVHFLLEQGEPSAFVPFLELSNEVGYDRALRQTYGIDGIASLETMWRDYAVTGNLPRKSNALPMSAGG